MTRIVHLARHGRTVWHEENRYAGTSDVPLDDRGRQQAAALADWAATQGLAAVRSSPLERAAETARAVAVRCGIPHRIDPDLHESGFGQGEGRTRVEMARLFPERLEAFLAAPATCPLPDGEAGAAAAARFVQALGRIDEEGPVLVVAHSTVLRLALCRLLGVPLDEYRARFPELGNATVTTLRLAVGAPAALLRLNAEVR